MAWFHGRTWNNSHADSCHDVARPLPISLRRSPRGSESTMPGTWQVYRHETGVPMLPGVYAFVGNGRVLYVGSSLVLGARIASYRFQRGTGPYTLTQWGMVSNFELRFRVVRRPGDWLRREYRLIRRLQPRFCQTYCTHKSEGLR